MRCKILVLLLLAFACPLFAQSDTIQQLVEAGRDEDLRWPDYSDYVKHLRNFYTPLNWQVAWTREGHVTPQALTIIGLFQRADSKGIHSADYDAVRWPDRLAKMSHSPSAADVGRFDLEVSINLMRYISDLHIGRINPRNLKFDLDIESKKYYLPKLLTDISTSPDPAAVLSAIEPPYEDYRRLQQALMLYRAIAVATANDPPLPEVKSLKPGGTYAGTAQLARFLQLLGDMPTSADFDAKRHIYDGAVVDGVKHFQMRHGLEANGAIGEKTFRALNTPISLRVKQIEWALERWRWAPMQFTTPPIIVNIPEFVLRGWDDQGKHAITMHVIVGQAYSHQTPVFSADMKYLVFRPYWNVPPHIQAAELVPKIAKNRGYLARNGYEIVDGDGKPMATDVVDDATFARLRSGEVGIRQKPGGSNALGLVKFIFPNQNNVYLHSTPSQELFSRSRRDFSHGCIRVEHPAGLAAWVLRDQPQWTPEKIRAAMDGKEPTVVTLPNPIPVLLIYTTAVVTEDGLVHFYDDIYGHDATLENALAAGYPYPA